MSAQTGIRGWIRDLLMGAKFAISGGREGWMRTLLTGVGVGLGVALLLVTTAIPSALGARDLRGDARSVQEAPSGEKAGHSALLMGEADTRFGGRDIYGRLLMPEGPDAPLPPGLEKFPADGEMAVSPALDKLLQSDEGTLLRERLDAKVTAVIGDEGLLGPGELAYYEGSDTLDQLGGKLVTGFGNSAEPATLDPVLALLIVLVFVALLTPVAVFIAAAVRFGGERRDRRLAALRLVGADGRMTRRIAAGEALAGSLAGLVLGAGFFAAARQSASGIELYAMTIFPGDLDPSPALAALVALAVPAVAVAVTLLAMRSVVIEPLGVVRTAKPSRRRVWWRLLLPVGGLGLLYPMIGMGNNNGGFSRWQVSMGVVMLLVGITALLPWLVETVVARLDRGGGVSWQLAVRRLQLSSGAAARLVNGIAVAIAGAIALQMMFTGVEGMYTRSTGNDPSRAEISASAGPGDAAAGRADDIAREVGGTKGIAGAIALSETHLATSPTDRTTTTNLTMGSCDALREVAHLPSCKDGDTFVLRGGWDDGSTTAVAKPGRTLFAVHLGDDSGHRPVAWTLPASAKVATSRSDPTGLERSGILATTKAAPKGLGREQGADIYIRLDPSVPQAAERARTAVRKADPTLSLFQLQTTEQSNRFTSIRTGLFIGATCVLLLIGASLLVSQLEQLRERKKLLSALVAFGTRRSTLSLSVLWQTAVPVAVGLLLSSAVGVALGAVLLKMVATQVVVDWASVIAMAGAGAGVVLLVTLLSLPPLLRLMRPEGLRTE